MTKVNNKNFAGNILIISLFLLFFIYTTYGLRNPAAVYCEAMGYEYVIEETPDGQIGLCKFPDGSTCVGFDFLKGKCGEDYSYCKKKGYEVRVAIGPEKCGPFAAPKEECVVCVLENGTEIEVTKLMGLDFREGVCGDGFCVFGENYNNCKEDCHSGTMDDYCDGIEDSICDPDCPTEQDEDCGITKISTTTTFKLIDKREELKIPGILTLPVLIVLFLLVVLLILFKFRRK